ncbi:hypothetical protein [Streptomyces sp. NPDC050535]|uniref:hypothetical protein n=1 Tax=Streptomyces sp. NPDC050535 TaxID=3365626 RepID=UPI0037AF040B
MSEHGATPPAVDAQVGIPLRLVDARSEVSQKICLTTPGGIFTGSPVGSLAGTGRRENMVSTATVGVTLPSVPGAVTVPLSRGRFGHVPGWALRAAADRPAQ